MDLITFKAIVDSASPGISPTTPLKDIFEYVGIQPDMSVTQKDAIDAIQNKLKKSFGAGHRSAVDHCLQWRRQLVLQHFLDGQATEPYLAVIERLIDALRGTAVSSELVEGDWAAAIQACIDLRSIENYNYDRDIGTRYIKELHYSNAIQYLEKRGLLQGRKSGEYPLTDQQDVMLAGIIERMVKRFGGINLARAIFRSLDSIFDAAQLRYHCVDRLNPISSAFPRVPFGYLLQLAAKHPHGTKPLQSTPRHLEELNDVSRAYACLYEVQPFNLFDGMFQDHITLIPYLQRVSLRDALFNLHQLRSSDVIRMIDGILNGMVIRGQLDEKTRESLKPIVSVIAGIQQVVGSRRGPISFKLEDVLRACPNTSAVEVQRIMNDTLSHGSIGANSRFSRLLEVPNLLMATDQRVGIDFFQKPCISNGTDSYLILEHSICAPAFIEAVLSQMRETISNLDEKVGHGMEAYVIALLRQHNIQAKYGDYKIDGQAGECDIVIETKNRVIFIETKKKSLTRAARAGQDASILIDLAQSLMHAQLQAGHHEIRLRRNKEIVLNDKHGNLLSTIKLDGREVERIALSLNDYGGFQDRLLLDQLLNGQMRHSYSATDERYASKFERINAQIKELSQQTEDIYELDGRPENPRFFFNCWFISLPQLLVLLDDVSDADEFEASLFNTRHISTGSQDLYSDHAYMKRMRSQASSEGKL